MCFDGVAGSQGNMTQTTGHSRDASPTKQRVSGSKPLAFETAQRELFEEVGLDARSQFIDLESPRVRMMGSKRDHPMATFRWYSFTAVCCSARFLPRSWPSSTTLG